MYEARKGEGDDEYVHAVLREHDPVSNSINDEGAGGPQR